MGEVRNSKLHTIAGTGGMRAGITFLDPLPHHLVTQVIHTRLALVREASAVRANMMRKFSA
jgi:hypothetical protein